MIRIRQISIPIMEDNKEMLEKKITTKLGIPNSSILSFKIRKKSIDARKKDQIHYVYEIDVQVLEEEKVIRKKSSPDLFLAPEEKYQTPIMGKDTLNNQVVIVGSGPAGLFAAYLLAENGYRPLVIERGDCIEKRIEAVNQFWETGILDPNCNVQFGEGGAGTFSDGKLNTLVKDKQFRGKKVFEIFVENGAPEEILYLQKPHIGTDLLRDVIKNMREKIIAMGGEFWYRSCLTNIVHKEKQLTSIEINHEIIIPCQQIILAIGHSARDTFRMLYHQGVVMHAKPFAIGVRIQHPQKMINESQYGEYASILPPASYKLTYTATNHRGVYSFCMCPGGYVVNASSGKEMLAINGMSNHQRESENANSALVVTVGPDDFGNHPLDGILYQEKLEKLTYQVGKGKIPIQLWKDFKENKISQTFGEVNPIFQGNYTFQNLNNVLPKEVSLSLKEAIPYFDKKIAGYGRDDAILAAIESRTSSPIHIDRDEVCLSNIKGIYPCGEGSGYAGGITTAAMDGIRVAEEIIKKYHN